MSEINFNDICPYCGGIAMSKVIAEQGNYKLTEYLCLYNKCGHFVIETKCRKE